MRNLQKEVDCLASPKLSTEQKVMDEIQNDPAKNSVGEDCEMLSVGVAKLKVDNRLLQQELQQCVQKNLQLKGIVQRQREERKVLEDCLFTVTSAKDILQLEVRKLQQDYLDLRKSISTQLRTKNLDASSGSLGLNEMLDFKDKERVYNSPKEQLAIDLIRKRLEEDELKRGTTEH
ncbi:CC110 protein, partial [Amia calva]|nr:CC110 protein [Amia calva]